MTTLTIDEALKILKEYSCIDIKIIESETDKEQLRQAIKLLVSLSASENFGVCANNYQQGFEALESYLKALGYIPQINPNLSDINDSPIYIKFSTHKMSYYTDSYSGSYRGVLISCQSEDDKLTGTYGHFPLDLFQ
ncbi:DUF1824 family protein [Aphanothece sacrum]|uniref:DUF1824 domain-containing protein n=1 Tax=Aphanothece sacrum FPU1 TaxID=1920663 RepID=A0A401IFM8_APHSA|nr:DUF1824 family protein [Aphanothece sacrum]GBF80093.1 hypothetical protein AsFPU1_1494 [Aphanothece sacrum FPU1]GBF87028.1 hypothetical protein AsFPU3_4107 [Aphanothece sacrum FPU3]